MNKSRTVMSIQSALKKIVEYFETKEINYMLFGGLVNNIYGQPRQTFDIDIKIFLDKIDLGSFLKNLKEVFKVLPNNPEKFISDTHVLPIEIDKIKIDIVFALLPYELNSIKNAVQTDYSGINLKVITPEDFIIHKMISYREKDWQDIIGVVINQTNNLNWDYILHNAKELSEMLDDSELINKLLKLKNG